MFSNAIKGLHVHSNPELTHIANESVFLRPSPQTGYQRWCLSTNIGESQSERIQARQVKPTNGSLQLKLNKEISKYL